MKRPTFFFDACGCESGGSYQQTGNSTPVCGADGQAIISDNKYFTLLKAPKGQALIVPLGANTQAFLTSTQPGFVTYSGGEIQVTGAPEVNLPIINPAVSGVFPPPGSFPYILVASGNPAQWKMLAAPTTGARLLRSNNGSWETVDAGSIPGINEIGLSSETTTKGGLMMIVDLGSSQYTLRRLNVVDKRVVVGDIDVGTGVMGYKSLPGSQPLNHPVGEFLESRMNKTVFMNDSGGILTSPPTATVVGDGAITDGKRLMHSATTQKIYAVPEATSKFVAVTTDSGAATVPTSYAPMPGGHGQGVAQVINYPKVLVQFAAGLGTGASSNTTSFGFFRDGALLFEYDNDQLRNVALSYVDENALLGSHTYSVQWKRTSGSTQINIKNSSLTTVVLPG